MYDEVLLVLKVVSLDALRKQRKVLLLKWAIGMLDRCWLLWIWELKVLNESHQGVTKDHRFQ